ncbi:MAG: hypothetical protein KBD16_03850 [Candidatus Pacebacteria bacterium]|nr:hypothetical protein [Candidatus Paceibacterota bacterium]
MTRISVLKTLAILAVVVFVAWQIPFAVTAEESGDTGGVTVEETKEEKTDPAPEPAPVEPAPTEDDPADPAPTPGDGGQETTVDNCIPANDFELRQLRDQYFKTYQTFDLAGGTVSITNEHPTCSFPFALKVFQVYSDPIHQIPQTLFDSDEKTIGPGQTKSFRVDLPSCRYQLDVVAFPGNQNYSSSAKLIKGQVYQQLPLCPQTPDWTLVCKGLPDPAKIGEPVTWTATVTGATGPVSYLWNGNDTFPDGATTNPVVVTYTNLTPSTKTANVAATFGDEVKTAQCSVNVVPPPQCPAGQPTITSPASASGQVGELFSHTVTTVGGLGTIVDITPINPAPGLSISGKTISGTPTQAGTYTYSVKAQNADGDPLCGPTQILTIVIVNTTVTCVPNVRGDLAVDDITINASGNAISRVTNNSSDCSYNVGLISYKVFSTTTREEFIDTQLEFDTDVKYSVGPGQTVDLLVAIPQCMYQVDVYQFNDGVDPTPTAHNLDLQIDYKVLNWKIDLDRPGCSVTQCPAQPTITSPSVAPQGTVGTAYTPFTVTTSGGVAPVSVTIAPINAAPGLTISGATISGTPTTAGTFTYSVRALSAGSEPSCNPPQTLTLTVVQSGPQCIPPTNLFPSGTLPADTTSVTLSWNPVPGAVSYNIRLDDGTTDRYDDPRFTTCANSPHYYCENNLTTTSVTNVPVKPGRTYSFWVDPNFTPGRNYCNASVKFTIPSTKPVPECTLEATPESIQKGDTVTLTWTSKNVTSATIDQGIGSVPLNGSTTTHPTADTTYIASFTGPYGSIACKDGVVIKTPGDDDDDDDDDDGGGGGGGRRRRPNVVLFSEPEVLGASISLTQVPYTGFGTSLLQIFLFVVGLIAISAGIVYAITRKLRAGAVQAIHTPQVKNISVEGYDTLAVDLDTTPSQYDEYFATTAPIASRPPAQRAPEAIAPRPSYNSAPAALEHVSAPVHQRMDVAPTPRTPMNTERAPEVQVDPVRIQNEARATRTLVSDDGALLIAHSVEGDEKKALERLSQVIDIAKTRYPREDGWLILDKDRVRESLFISTLSMIPLFVEWIVRGEDKKVFTFLRMLKHQEQPVADFMRKVVADLDGAHRARLEGAEERAHVNAHIAEVTYHLSNKELETIVSELLHGVDERYDSAYTSVRLSLVRVLDIVKERSLRSVGSAYAFSGERETTA